MNKLIFLFLVLTSFGFAQNKNIYSKKGFAIEGYDVVSYFDNKTEKGNSEFAVEHEGSTFLFTSKEHLELFKNSPEKYLPEYGGYCAYGVAAKNKKFPINPTTFEIRNDKLYLFYNAWGTNTLDSWLKEKPDNLVKEGDINWKNLTN